MTTTRRAPLRRVVAVAVIAAAGLILSGCSVLAQITNTTPRDASGTPTAASNADVFSIKVGDCLDDSAAAGTVTTAPIVPCSTAHDSEAYTTITMADGAFPGDDAVKSRAEEGCAAAYPDFVGIAYDDSRLSISYYFPTAESWANGDREIICTVYDEGKKTTGTLKNAKR